MSYLVTTEVLILSKLRRKLKFSVSTTEKYAEYTKSSLSEKILINEHRAK